jgi:type II secretory pathway predicted ATPase ExeA
MDYLKYWSIREKPFSRDSARRFFYGPPQREAIARLHYIVAGGMSCGILAAPSGCGMSSLIRHVARSSGFGDCAVEMVMTHVDAATPLEVFQSLADSLRLSTTPATVETDVRSAFSATSRQGVRTVWLVDGACETANAVARSLIDGDELLTVIAGTNPDRATRTAIQLGACPLRIELTPLGLEDVGLYLLHALESVGCHHRVFADSAIVRLYEMTDGELKRLSQLAELALLVGAASRVKQVHAELIDAVQDELVRAA